MPSELASEEYKPCNTELPLLKGAALRRMEVQLAGGWSVRDEQQFEKTFKFKDFRQALDFTSRVAEIAEEQAHHPDIFPTYGNVGIRIWTHKIKGLTENDFILAAKINEMG